MATISIFLAVLSTLFVGWLGHKYQEREIETFFINITEARKGKEVKIPVAPDFGSLLIIMLAMVFFAIAIALTLTL